MDREAFERLLSDWLDEPGREDLRERVEAAARRDAPFAKLRDQSVKLDALTRGLGAQPLAVDWQRLRGRIVSAVEPDANDPGLDTALRDLPGVEDRVNWAQLQERIVAGALAGAAECETPPLRSARVIRFPRRMIIAASLITAAAAAIALSLRLFPDGTTASVSPAVAHSGVAWAAVLAASSAVSESRSDAVVQAGIAPEQTAPEVALAAPSEFFLMIEPAGGAAGGLDAAYSLPLN